MCLALSPWASPPLEAAPEPFFLAAAALLLLPCVLLWVVVCAAVVTRLSQKPQREALDWLGLAGKSSSQGQGGIERQKC